ncbi:MAG: tetratricopeptide repeat protein [Candidatus Limnocylindria bacterium]
MTGPGRDTGTSLDEVRAAFDGDSHEDVLRLTERMLAERPGDDAAHEFRARSLMASGRLEEAERHAQDAVRLDPDEIRYRELLAQILSIEGAHRDAAAEFARLARNDPRQARWTVAEAKERLGAAQPAMGVEAARRAVTLDPTNGQAQLALSQALVRTGDARGAFQAARQAAALLPDDPFAREALADAQWLADDAAAAFAAFRALSGELDGADAARVTAKARALYRQRAGWAGRLLAAAGPVFRFALGRGWLRIGQ